MKTWKQRAEEAIKAGYQPGGPWELQLKRHLERLFPEKVKELGNQLADYLGVQTARAQGLQDRMLGQGTAADVAERLALEELLEKPENEQDGTRTCEAQGAAADMFDATMRHLLRRALQNPQPPTTRPT